MKKNTLLSKNFKKYGVLFDILRRSSDELTIITNEILKRFPKKKDSMLDIGAADCLITQQIMQKFNKIYAIDYNPDNKYFFKFLGINGKISRWENFKVNQKFDFVLASHVFYYFKDSEYILQIKKILKILKKGGCMCIILNGGAKSDYSELLDNIYPKIYKENPYSRLSSFEKELKNNNFSFEYKVLNTKFHLENLVHFISLCQFFLGKEIRKKSQIYNEAEYFYNNKLKTINQKKIMSNHLKFIWIKKT